MNEIPVTAWHYCKNSFLPKNIEFVEDNDLRYKNSVYQQLLKLDIIIAEYCILRISISLFIGMSARVVGIVYYYCCKPFCTKHLNFVDIM